MLTWDKNLVGVEMFHGGAEYNTVCSSILLTVDVRETGR